MYKNKWLQFKIKLFEIYIDKYVYLKYKKLIFDFKTK